MKLSADKPVGRPNWGDCYLNHFQTIFNAESDKVDVFRPLPYEGQPVIQVMHYNKYLPGCRSFVTLGLSRYNEILGGRSEVLVTASAGGDDIPNLVAHALFYFVKYRMHFGPGVVFRHMSAISPDFAQRYGKSAWYFTSVDTIYSIPMGAVFVSCGSERGLLLAGYLISDQEVAFYDKYGPAELETYWEANKVDLLNIERSSSV